ncbi:hypothetical protein SDC9_79658 [bioreactor metagenome]|uniref:Uncharacterized protein n=1 Tax=bioreactor metagenome TaxID=1076179 RepID=A0A644YZ27_9ZZZZ
MVDPGVEAELAEQSDALFLREAVHRAHLVLYIRRVDVVDALVHADLGRLRHARLRKEADHDVGADVVDRSRKVRQHVSDKRMTIFIAVDAPFDIFL